MNKVYLLTGGNLGHPMALLDAAKAAVAQHCGEVVTASSLYRTAAWGLHDQPDFLNQVLHVLTPLPPLELLRQLQQIEERAGRLRREKYGPRLLDIDILFFNDAIINTARLQVPHPQMGNRRFVLVPLAEIAPEMVHPITKLTVVQMLEQCSDYLAVHKL
jgi:2-amino-4-hydroxy-6-hydroxymethyldihydropteridine diphosphokinase